jgi:hypothetical protein
MTDQRALIGTGRRSEHVLCCCSVVAVYRLTLYLSLWLQGPKGNNAGVTLSKCTQLSAQEWSFERTSPGPGPPSPTPHIKQPEWGQSFGPLNLKLKTK